MIFLKYPNTLDLIWKLQDVSQAKQEIGKNTHTVSTLYYDVLRCQFKICLIFQIVAEVLYAMTIEDEEAVERWIRAASKEYAVSGCTA